MPEVIMNDTITLFCPASGMPSPDVTWYLENEIPITSNMSGMYVIDNGFRLRIDNAQLSHVGRYTCRAQNIAGLADKHFDLSVLGNYVFDLCLSLVSRLGSIYSNAAGYCRSATNA